MFALSGLMSVLPSLVVTIAWVVGLVLAAIHPARAGWRSLAMGGFGTLTAAGLVGLVPTIILMTSGYRRGVPVLFPVVGLVAMILHLVGAGLLIAAVLSGRRRPVPSAPQPDPGTPAP